MDVKDLEEEFGFAGDGTMESRFGSPSTRPTKFSIMQSQITCGILQPLTPKPSDAGALSRYAIKIKQFSNRPAALD
ncbi:hypothetical protein OIDMADRAFT_20804 [Oidiodendron maius Zn]|uniref:Uncharacterized protein n=1 Tax=Oidiodendron maius (strain Zn) TaxID=913774 RepID=A0A0C3D3D8_OIDMZ|nr:hypothetical protein OIDMADRAFT_20804 [Oidiodendron maius Zn]